MKKLFLSFVAAAFALAVVVSIGTAQGRLSPQGGTITSVTAGSGTTGGGSGGPVTINVGCGSGVTCSADAVAVDYTAVQARIGTGCGSGSAVQAVGSDGTPTCISAGGAGDIEGVTAGSGMTGGGTSGSVTLDLVAAHGGGILVAADAFGLLTSCSSSQILRWSGSAWACSDVNAGSTSNCFDGTVVMGINADGSPSCDAPVLGVLATDEVTTKNVTDEIVATDVQPTKSISLAATTYTDWDPAINEGQTTLLVDVDVGESCDQAWIRSISDHAADGQRIRIHNTCGTITFEDASSSYGTAAYRILTPTGVAWDLLEDDTADLFYDPTASRWRIVHEPDELIAGSVGPSQLVDDLDLSGNGYTKIGRTRGLTEEISTAGSTQNDLAVAATTRIVRYTASTSTTLTGIAFADGNADGDELWFVVDDTYIVTPSSEAAGSTAANRISGNGDGFPSFRGPTVIRFVYSGGSVNRWRVAYQSRAASFVVASTLTVTNILGTGTMTLGNGDTDVTTIRMPKDDSTAPSISGGGCGTGATVVGGSWAFQITIGTGGSTSCVATFASTKTLAPTCNVSTSGTRLPSVTTTATTVTLSQSSGMSEADVIHVTCIGRTS